MGEQFKSRHDSPAANTICRADSSISAMRPPCYYLLEEIVILGVIYGSLVWMVCNPAAPAGPRGIPGLSPDLWERMHDSYNRIKGRPARCLQSYSQKLLNFEYTFTLII